MTVIPPSKQLLQLLSRERETQPPPIVAPGEHVPSLNELLSPPVPSIRRPKLRSKLTQPLRLMQTSRSRWLSQPSTNSSKWRRVLLVASAFVFGPALVVAIVLAVLCSTGCASTNPGLLQAEHASMAALALGAVFALARLLRQKRSVRSAVADGVSDEGRGLNASRASARHLMSCSVTGPVRTRNEDRVLLATVCEIELLLVADGMGGHPRGDDAADIASTFALLALDRRLNELRDPTPQAVRAVLLETVWHVGGELARASPDPDSLRTTLIVVAVLKNAIVAAWIGDGAVSVARRDGTVIELLVPHREPSGLLNHVLHASLGPVVEGSPRWCIAMRQPGDLLIVATDGLADTRPADMVIQLRAAFNMPHREQALRDLIARWAIEARTDGEFLRTDNLTVAMHYDRAESMSP